ncbi:MAG: hypothetical protein MUO26_09975, partial [Methanotrichaceae archaeon]|nr:hypothetical protein [Methanotrichaceae archaeon]
FGMLINLLLRETWVQPPENLSVNKKAYNPEQLLCLKSILKFNSQLEIKSNRQPPSHLESVSFSRESVHIGGVLMI